MSKMVQRFDGRGLFSNIRRSISKSLTSSDQSEHLGIITVQWVMPE